MIVSCSKVVLNEYLPLKQGLRPLADSLKSANASLNEYLPLKQGLRRASGISTEDTRATQ